LGQRFVIVLSGVAEIEVDDGDHLRFARHIVLVQTRRVVAIAQRSR
jgi:hypothetical protein